MRVKSLYDQFRKPFSLSKEVGQGICPYLPTADGISTGILTPAQPICRRSGLWAFLIRDDSG